MDIDITSERAQAEAAMVVLARKLRTLDQDRQETANAILKLQGVLEYLQQIGGE